MKAAGGVHNRWRTLKSLSRHTVSPRLAGWSVLVGLLSGIVVSSFRWIPEHSLRLATRFYSVVLPAHVMLLIPLILGLLAASLIIGKLVVSQPLIQGSGIPDIESRLRKQSSPSFPWWSVLWKKFIGGVLYIGSGLFAGREGPCIQMGACVGMGLSGSTMTTKTYKRELVAAGAAAGLSAAFNAPIAAVLFVTEEVYGKFNVRIGIAAFTAALSANAVSTMLFGTAPVFILPRVETPHFGQYWQMAVLAVLLGLIAWVYEITLLRSHSLFTLMRIPRGLRSLLPMLLTALIGISAPQLLGGGNALVTLIGNHHYTFGLLTAFLLIRFVLSQITYGSGSPGGIFLPILTLGALAGAAWGSLLTTAPFTSAGTDGSGIITLMLILGMSGLFGAVSKAPITSIILVTEMTSYDLLMPLGFVTLISYLTFDILGGKPIYDALAQSHE